MNPDCDYCLETQHGDPAPYVASDLLRWAMWQKGYHQEKCFDCGTYNVWVPGAPAGMWAIGFMRGERPYPLHEMTNLSGFRDPETTFPLAE